MSTEELKAIVRDAMQVQTTDPGRPIIREIQGQLQEYINRHSRTEPGAEEERAVIEDAVCDMGVIIQHERQRIRAREHDLT